MRNLVLTTASPVINSDTYSRSAIDADAGNDVEGNRNGIVVTLLVSFSLQLWLTAQQLSGRGWACAGGSSSTQSR